MADAVASVQQAGLIAVSIVSRSEASPSRKQGVAAYFSNCEKESDLEAALLMEKATVQPYLFFGGGCDEAFEFYKTALHAKVGMVMRFNQSPRPTPPGMLAPGFEDKIMHCSFQVGGTTVMASDGCEPNSQFVGFKLALSVPTETDADRVFNALADGGKIEMPLVNSFWSPRFGMVADKFGVDWMVMVPGPNHG
ncbi:MAG: VOC family protein [Planctomycetia bacterium]|nr:VOC family protein [Planctomycetia bacterium]